jgi:hypothetical protein
MNKQRLKRSKSSCARTAEPAQPTDDKVRAVAFKIEDQVYEGRPGASHVTLYLSLLLQKRVPADTLDIWTREEKSHGFVTEKGEFLDRSEVFRRFGAARSQDLQAKGICLTAR